MVKKVTTDDDYTVKSSRNDFDQKVQERREIAKLLIKAHREMYSEQLQIDYEDIE